MSSPRAHQIGLRLDAPVKFCALCLTGDTGPASSSNPTPEVLMEAASTPAKSRRRPIQHVFFLRHVRPNRESPR